MQAFAMHLRRWWILVWLLGLATSALGSTPGSCCDSAAPCCAVEAAPPECGTCGAVPGLVGGGPTTREALPGARPPQDMRSTEVLAPRRPWRPPD